MLKYVLRVPSSRPDDEPLPLVLVMHGRGADANDLADLAPMLDLPGGARFVFPNAPTPFEAAPGMTFGFTWFDGWPARGASLQESRALSACTSDFLVPFSNKPIPDPVFNIPNSTFLHDSQHTFVALAAESRQNDANTPLFRLDQGAGAYSAVQTDQFGHKYVQFGGMIDKPEGSMPAVPAHRPVFRPGSPCEKQQLPDLNAPVGPAETTAPAAPSRTSRHARTIDESGRERTAAAGSSDEPITSLASFVRRSRPAASWCAIVSRMPPSPIKVPAMASAAT